MSNISTNLQCILIGESGVGKSSLVVSYATNDYLAEHKPTALEKYAIDITVENQLVHFQICDAGGSPEVASLRKISYSNVHTVILCFSVVQPETFRALKTKWLPELVYNVFLNPSAAHTAKCLGYLPRPTSLRLNDSSRLVESSRTTLSISSSQSVAKAMSTSPSRNPSGRQVPLKSAKCRQKRKSQAYSCRLPGPAFILVGCACDLRNDIGCLLNLSHYGEKPVDEYTAKLLAIEFGAEAYIECSALTQKHLKKVFDLAIWCGLRVKDAGGPVSLCTPDCVDSILEVEDNGPSVSPLNGKATINAHFEPYIERPFKAQTPSPLTSKHIGHSPPRRHQSFEASADHRTRPLPCISPTPSADYSSKSMWRRILCIP